MNEIGKLHHELLRKSPITIAIRATKCGYDVAFTDKDRIDWFAKNPRFRHQEIIRIIDEELQQRYEDDVASDRVTPRSSF